MTWEQIKEACKIVGAVGGFIVSAGLWKWAQKKWTHWKNNRAQYRILQAQQIADLSTKIDFQSQQNDKIIKQVFPNGGSSFFDTVVNRLDGINNSLSELKIGQRNNREIAGIPSWESDSEGRVTYVSPSLCELYGVMPEDILDSSWIAMVIPEDRQRVINAWQESIKYASPYEIKFKILTQGKVQEMLATAIHNKDKNGKVVNSLGKAAKIK